MSERTIIFDKEITHDEDVVFGTTLKYNVTAESFQTFDGGPEWQNSLKLISGGRVVFPGVSADIGSGEIPVDGFSIYLSGDELMATSVGDGSIVTTRSIENNNTIGELDLELKTTTINHDPNIIFTVSQISWPSIDSITINADFDGNLYKDWKTELSDLSLGTPWYRAPVGAFVVSLSCVFNTPTSVSQIRAYGDLQNDVTYNLKGVRNGEESDIILGGLLDNTGWKWYDINTGSVSAWDYVILEMDNNFNDSMYITEMEFHGGSNPQGIPVWGLNNFPVDKDDGGPSSDQSYVVAQGLHDGKSTLAWYDNRNDNEWKYIQNELPYAIERVTNRALVGGDKTGNNRGLSAIDIQAQRASDTEVAHGAYSIAIGGNNTAQGGNSVVIGTSSTAEGTPSIAHGFEAQALGDYSTAIGQQVAISGDYSLACGRSINMTGDHATSFGTGHTIDSVSGMAIGFGNTVPIAGTGSTAIGQNITNDTAYSLEIGPNNDAKVAIKEEGAVIFPGADGSPTDTIPNSGFSFYTEGSNIKVDAVDGGGTPFTKTIGGSTTGAIKQFQQIQSITPSMSGPYNVTYSNTSPVTGEGRELFMLQHTPLDVNNLLKVEALVFMGLGSEWGWTEISSGAIALFKNPSISDSSVCTAPLDYISQANNNDQHLNRYSLVYYMSAGTTDPIDFYLHGCGRLVTYDDDALYVSLNVDIDGFLSFGDTVCSSMSITEYSQ